MNFKDIILSISLLSNLVMFYEYFNLIKKIQLIETKCSLLESQMNQSKILPIVINHNDIFFYGSIGLLFILSVIAIQNNNLDSSIKTDEYQADIIKILTDISNNTSLEKTEYIFLQLQTILINQQIIIQNLEKYNNISFIADPSAQQLAAQLLQTVNL